MNRFFIALMLFLALLTPSLAVNPDEILDNPVLEQRARSISAGLRCLVCQNQSIDDSDADLAKDLRIVVRERLVAGDSDSEIMEFVVARYGEFVLLKPVFAGHNLVLWLTAPILFLIGAIALFSVLRNRQPKPNALSPQEEAALAQLLKSAADDEGGTDGEKHKG
ncbi:cytochrome c-type biogenesis protein [Maritalea porphyrae]|mgnify:FL=1|jgi:cytochrome c-type biogenesis protein CcmH|uniref:cytochrome c-type biogenesis protein n=1 Tax=Maritalea porphyrae TaxID=880732 RepID=UPI0022B07EF0|nr:cytochrome c-type biogenesis protein [Maritalea porphyrae]MCZ4271136.1 cytochrome c-type biogenesis protein CcmH [Maritalea porphyrae]